jgi:hypothetical protein
MIEKPMLNLHEHMNTTPICKRTPMKDISFLKLTGTRFNPSEALSLMSIFFIPHRKVCQ